MSDVKVSWNNEERMTELGADVPAWVESWVTAQDVMAIQQCGCESGAYMPAVTYGIAAETMGRHGDDVLQYIEDCYGELPKPPDNISWSGMASFYLSCAVELWASQFEEGENEEDEGA